MGVGLGSRSSGRVGHRGATRCGAFEGVEEGEGPGLHPVEAQTRAGIPNRGVDSVDRVAISPETAARGANQGDRQAGANEATHFGIRSLPFGRQSGG
jgi:hypothetical protein